MTDTPHPARSPQFLSRLHDGELSSPERSAFDQHAAACSLCRAAVAEFEASLAAFRTAPTAAPASDLSARILRKIRAQSPSRRPFGVTFGIDLRWAGAAIAALLAVMIGAPFLMHRDDSAHGRPAQPLSVHLTDKESDRRKAAAPDAQPPAKEAAKAAPAPRLREEQAPLRAAAPPAAPPPAAGPQTVGQFASRESGQKPAAAQKLQARAPSPLRDLEATSVERAGGEEAVAVDAAEMKPEVVRLTVRPLDGLGEAPAVVHAPSDAELSALRGREFVLIVEADGHVREDNPPQALAKRKDAAANAAPTAEPIGALRELRFTPNDRPRRLLLRVE